MLSSKDLPELVKDVTLGASIPGVVLSVLFLAAVAYLQWNPVSRPHLDRTWKKQVLAALSSHSYMGLVLILGVNGNKMEKYYLLGVAILCGACNIPPWLAGKFGWDATTGKCWLRDPSPAVQQRWIIGTRSVPTILMSVIDVFSFVNILIFMLLQVVGVANLCNWSLYTGMHQNPTDFHMNLRILNACVYSIRPLLYALLAAIDPSFLRAVCSLRAEPLSQTATTISFGWASMQLAGQFSGTSSAEQKTSSARDCERQPRSEEELQSEKIAHQI
ncbi:hypothetical protein B0H13DRAFT_1916956 [Mycena leptocephala]|nr:hypothetical protein B0H13DRAFT_1916956 [Mycena leptocephala]